LNGKNDRITRLVKVFECWIYICVLRRWKNFRNVIWFLKILVDRMIWSSITSLNRLMNFQYTWKLLQVYFWCWVLIWGL